MCDLCGMNIPIVETTLIDKNGIRTFCLNCIAIQVQTVGIKLENDPDFQCELTKKYGAVKFVSYDEEYCLDQKIMQRLISYNLTSIEWKKLYKKYGEKNHMIHSDYYDEDGIALQPIDNVIVN